MVENKKLKRDLVLQSFAPLFFILCVKHAHCYWAYLYTICSRLYASDWTAFNDILNHPYLGDAIVFFGSLLWVVCSIFVYMGFVGMLKNNCDSRGEQIIISADRRDSGASFLVTFLIPLLIDDVDTIKGFLVFTILLILMIRLLINSNLFYQNPVLTIIGYRIFEFKFLNPYKDVKADKIYIGITKGNIISEELTIKRKYISDDVFLVFNS